ncbi:hypothetical protein ACQKP1_23095 [Allorhizobium sp. NPDC080224]|uniref:hypothetical protein n=1 Tax=Allorhizobium sp. NPDC080224 TaxID=3390547 RepID=UPI003D021D57
MKAKSSVESVVADADGTDAEENRQLTNLLLQNAIAPAAAETTFKPNVRSESLKFVELVFLTLTFFLLIVYSFASRGSEEDQDGLFY